MKLLLKIILAVGMLIFIAAYCLKDNYPDSGNNAAGVAERTGATAVDMAPFQLEKKRR